MNQGCASNGLCLPYIVAARSYSWFTFQVFSLWIANRPLILNGFSQDIHTHSPDILPITFLIGP